MSETQDSTTPPRRSPEQAPQAPAADATPPIAEVAPAEEIGGPPGPEPTRFGDWERKGRCIDF